MIQIEIPMQLPPRGNARDGHWAKRSKRVRRQRELVRLSLFAAGVTRPTMPASVRLTRIAPRRLDSAEADSWALKAVRDEVAVWLGVDDADERVRWFYAQAVDGRPRYQAARIEMVAGHHDCECCEQPVFGGDAK